MTTALRRAGERRVVGIAEMHVSADPDDLIVTYALGSCIGLVLWDPEVRVGGMLHAMLPSHALDPERARVNPERFVDTGVPALFRACYALGAEKRRMVTRVAGGSRMVGGGGPDNFQTGRRNVVMLKRLLWKNGVLLEGEETGGSISRTVSLHVGTGELLIRSGSEVRELRPPRREGYR